MIRPMYAVYASLTLLHDTRLVALAVIVGLIGTINAFAMLRRARLTAGRTRVLWLLGAALVFGLGSWSLNFIALLAYRPGITIGFHLPLAVASLAVVAFGALPAFLVALAPRHSRFLAPFLSGTILGIAVVVMHKLGLASLRLPGIISQAEPYTVAGIAAAMVLSIAAMALAWGRPSAWRETAAAIVLGLAGAALHFITLAGVTIAPLDIPMQPGFVLDPPQFATLIAAASLIVTILFSLAGTQFDAWLHRLLTVEADRTKRLAEASFEGLLIHRAGRVLSMNRALVALTGRHEAEMRGADFTVLAPEAERHRLSQGLEIGDVAAEVTLLRADGAPRTVELLSRPIDHEGQPATVTAIRDVTERKEAEARIAHLAHHDPLTGLANRLLFNERLDHGMAMADRGGDGLALLMLDLDRFKAVNDTYGHAAGDALIREAAARIAANIRETDTGARLGGDEFAIIMPAIAPPAGTEAGAEAAAGALALAHRLETAFAAPFAIEGKRLSIGVSIGIAGFPDHATDREALMRAADIALYRSKQGGRGRTCLYAAPEQAEPHAATPDIEAELRRALTTGGITLVYQPIFAAGSARPAGFEALARWTHPALGVIPPSTFIPLAERTGLIDALGAHVLEAACEAAAGWPEPWRVAVNLSPVQFRDPALTRRIAGTLVRTGLDAARLDLEITENTMIGDAEAVRPALADLKRLGVTIVLDDFGTAYAGLRTVRDFAFDKIKIDRGFIADLGEGERKDEGAEAVVAAILTLGRALNLEVTAEGVETPSQLAHLQKSGCALLQGDLLGRPVPDPAAAYLLSPPLGA